MEVHIHINALPLLLRLRNGERRLAYGAVNAINTTGHRIQDAERQRVSSLFTVRRTKFVMQQAAVMKHASVRQGRAFAEIYVGQKDRLLLSQFEAGGARLPFTQGAKAVALPDIGGPARPSLSSEVPRAFTFKGLRIIKRITKTRSGKKRSVRGRADVDFDAHLTKGGKVQFKGRLRTFILAQTKQLPDGGVFQRIGPGRNDIRTVYSFRKGLQLQPVLGWINTAQQIADQWFNEDMEAEAIKALARDRGRSFGEAA